MYWLHAGSKLASGIVVGAPTGTGIGKREINLGTSSSSYMYMYLIASITE